MSFLAQATCITAICIAGAMHLARNVETDDATLGAEAIVEPEPVIENHSASVHVIPRRDGQFFAQGRVNSGSVRFLVDTGASTVALTLEDARKSGIDISRLDYTSVVQTANGRTMAAPVTLRDVRIGGVRVTNVRALVLNEGLHISLLGMSYLGELQKVEVLPEHMVLRR